MFESFGEGAIQPDSPPPTSYQSLVVDAAFRRATGDAHGRIVLLRAVDVVGEIVIDSDAIKLRGRLILFGPASAAIERNVCAAVVALNHPIRIVGRDPEIVIVAVRHSDVVVGASAIV